MTVRQGAGLREREVKLAAPPGFRLLDLGGVADDVVATAAVERRMTTVYWDTGDLRLIRWGCTLRHRAGEGWTVKLPDGNGHAPPGALVRTELVFSGPASHPPDGALDIVRAYLRTAAVAPVAQMRTLRRAVTLRHAGGPRLVEIDDDLVSVYEGRRVAARFREVEVELDPDAPEELLTAVVERLRAGGAGDIDPTPKLVRALGEPAVAPADVVVEELPSIATAGDAVRRALAASVVRLVRHDAGVRLGDDPEEVHQARVATRRLRSDLRTFAPLLDRTWAEELRAQISWLTDELGTVRDTEVLRERFEGALQDLPEADRSAGICVLESLDAAIASARGELLVAMRSPRYTQLLDRLVEAANSPAVTGAAQASARQMIPGLVRKPWRSLRTAARRCDANSSDDALHDLRIRAKRCRYAAEAAAAVVGRRASSFARRVADLQQVLGDLHDAVVAEAWLRQYHARPADTEAFVVGELCALQRIDARRARQTWPTVWKRISVKGVRSWM